MFEFFHKLIHKGYTPKDPPRYTKNSNGGLTPSAKFDLSRSEYADLISLPKDVPGTNCSNCLYINNGICHNSRLYGIQVNERMCCIYWDHEGSIRPWEDIDG
jgi:hypothetical protein